MDPASDLAHGEPRGRARGRQLRRTPMRSASVSRRRAARVFVPGRGEHRRSRHNRRRARVVLDDDAHPFALLSTQGPLAITETEPDTDQPGARPRLVVSARTETALKRATGAAPASRRASTSRSSSARRARRCGGASTSCSHVTGREGRRASSPARSERAHVIALDEEGHPQVRAVVDRAGTLRDRGADHRGAVVRGARGRAHERARPLRPRHAVRS